MPVPYILGGEIGRQQSKSSGRDQQGDKGACLGWESGRAVVKVGHASLQQPGLSNGMFLPGNINPADSDFPLFGGLKNIKYWF